MSVCPSTYTVFTLFLMLQLRKQLASESERQTKLELSRQIQADSEGNSMIPLLGSSVEPLHLISILKAYRDLGYHPSQGLLIAAEPFLCCLHSLMPSGPALDLISLFGAFDWRPGQCKPSAEGVVPLADDQIWNCRVSLQA